MRVLVTGAAGFIGRNVCRELKAQDHYVIGLDNLDPQVHGIGLKNSPHLKARWDEKHEFENCDISAWTDVLTVGRFHPDLWDVDAVIHLAARVGVGQSQYQPRKYVETNTGGTLALWEAILACKPRRVCSVVVASSMSVYGEGTYYCRAHEGLVQSVTRKISPGRWDDFNVMHDADHIKKAQLSPCDTVAIITPEWKEPEPVSVYAQSKLDTERYSLILGKAYGIRTVALRFFGVYGPGQSLSNPYTGVLAQFACRALNNEPALIFEDGLQTRDFVYVEDVARAVVHALEGKYYPQVSTHTTPAQPVEGVYNVCTGAKTSVLDLANRWNDIARRFGCTPPEPQILGTFRSGDVRHCVGDPMRLSNAGWNSQVRLDDGLMKVADWIISEKLDVDRPVDSTVKAMSELKEHRLIV